MSGSDSPQKSDRRVLLIGENTSKDQQIQEALKSLDLIVSSTKELTSAIKLCQTDDYPLIVLDLDAVSAKTESLAEQLTDLGTHTSLLLLARSQQKGLSLELLRDGADDVIFKPITSSELAFAVQKASARNRIRRENELLKAQVSKRFSFSNIVGQSSAMEEIFETVRKVCEYKTTVMLFGESGTGKELIARAIHGHSPRKNKPFIAINCAAIPENLLESELFGHKKGAFTDATRDKKGLFEEAEGGTILLDEVGELPLHLQVKLLRVLQENEIRPVGDNRSISIDVRIIAATLRNLENDVLEGRFRDDLFYRLNVVSIRIPALRERREDIPLLVNFFIKRNREKLGLAVYDIEKDAMAALLEHPWPGNIRELENCIERAMILTEGESISLGSLPRAVQSSRGQTALPPVLDDDLSIKVHTRSLEENLIRRALAKTGGNRTHAAKLLEISHRTLLYKLKEYGLGASSEDANTASAQDETDEVSP